MTGGMAVAFNNESNHKHMRLIAKIKRQATRDPLIPGGDTADGTDAGNDDDGTTTPGDDNGSSSLSLGRPSSGDESSTSTSSTTSRSTRSTASIPSTTTTPTTTSDTTTSPTTTSTRSSSTVESVITTTIETTSTSTSFSSIETSSSIPSTTTEEEVETSSSTTLLESTTALTQDDTTTSATTRPIFTSIVTASAALTASLSSSSVSNSLASSASDSNSSNGPSAGTVVGIVAGALVGVVVLSGIVGYFFRTKCRNKDDDGLDEFDGENPFGNMDHHDGAGGYGGIAAGATRAEMRRDSQLLADDGDSIHQMSELNHGTSSYGNAAPVLGAMGAGAAAGAYALNRGDSTGHSSAAGGGGGALPGLQRNDTVNPRPPTMISRHYANQAYNAQQQAQSMPSFQPGQIVYPSSSANQSGPYPSFPVTGGNSPPTGGAGVPIGGVFPSSSSGSNNGHGGYDGGLDRQGSFGAGNHNNRMPDNAFALGAASYGDNGGYPSMGHAHAHNPNQYQQEYLNEEMDDGIPQRTGTPEYANPQQYFHKASDSYGSSAGMPVGAGGGVNSPFDDANASPARNFMNHSQFAPSQQQQQQYQQQAGEYGQAQGQGNRPRENAMRGAERAKRTLSVRNGGLSDADDLPRDSVYGGM